MILFIQLQKSNKRREILFSLYKGEIMDKITQVNKIRNELRAAADAYYNTSTPIMSDEQYDYKLSRLQELETELKIELESEMVGAPVLKGLKTIPINPPMLSLEKCHSAEEVLKFANGVELMASIKCDGVSTRLIYENGELISANTRGNGVIGTDITKHCQYYTNIPKKIDYKERIIIDGETIIKDDDFEMIKEEQKLKNSRNAVAGTLNTLDMAVVANRRLSFIAWDSPETELNYFDILEKLTDLDFEVVPHTYLFDIKDIDNINNDLMRLAEIYHIPTDGVVWRINDREINISRGRTAHSFSGSISWKPQYEEYMTFLRSIDYDVSRQGILTPVAVFDPVIIDGTEVSRASLSNISILKSVLGEKPFVGQEIYVIKSNKIIPMIVRAKDEYGEDI